ncbi:glycosyltransferase [Desulfofustis glycolicus]|uniref:Glycosyltransferase involved in cell wall bisynthesis n=1 Tax=Desulfofustis glycolicus DSM 9705 TaxID=1121409 RepID=A0A1M5YS00_9BACT|nr:glycosyltransferase [Desulfofustis glycolicus]SHI14751.1 Glycosyltransferase involved in cell wall bisynthesis [Desulfofustis glycolicus DSM 9705]
MKYNVLYIIESMNLGGTEKQLCELINGLSANGVVRPHLCTLKPSSDLLDSINCPKIDLGTRRLLSLDIPQKIKKLARFCNDYEICLVQTFFQDPSVIGAMLKLLLPVKLIITFRDLGFWRTRLENFKMRLAYKRADGFIANSLAVKKHFSINDGLALDKIKVIYNGFDMTELEGYRSGSVEDGLREIGIVANLNRPVKRVQDFIAAAALVRAKNPNVVFSVIGDGHLRMDLERFTDSLGLNQVVNFVGRLENPLEHIANFSVGVITSETEGLSNAIIEYMACSVPVVATNTGGNPELVLEGENGFLYPVGNVEVLADRILKLLDDNVNQRIGRNNRERVASNLSLSYMVKCYENHYQDMLSGCPLQPTSLGGQL